MRDRDGILCLVAGQRSGTTALRSALDDSGAFHNFGEIFKPEGFRDRGSFLDYAQSRNLQVDELATVAGATTQLETYLNHLRALAGPEKNPLIDVKLNFWTAIRPFWGYIHQEPFLLSVLRRQNTRFIFVARKNIVAQITSEHIARHANKWHWLKEDEIKHSFRVDPAAAAEQACLTILSEIFMYGFLKGTGRLFAVWYEDLFVDGRVAPSLADWLDGEFGLTLRKPLASKIPENKVRKEAVIENFREVQFAISEVVRRFGRVEFD